MEFKAPHNGFFIGTITKVVGPMFTVTFDDDGTEETFDPLQAKRAGRFLNLTLDSADEFNGIKPADSDKNSGGSSDSDDDVPLA